MARTNLDSRMFLDVRFKLVAQALGVRVFEVWGQFAFVWHFCTEHETDVLAGAYIDALTETPGFAEAALSADLLERTESDAQFRVKGARGRIEWLKELRDRGKRGGRSGRNKRKKRKIADAQANAQAERMFPLEQKHKQTLKQTHLQKQKGAKRDRNASENTGESELKQKLPPLAPALAPALAPNVSIFPSAAGGGKTRKGASSSLSPTATARLAVNAAVSLLRRQHECGIGEAATDELARSDLGADNFSLILRKYSSWRQFVVAYKAQAANGYGPHFEGELVKALRAFIQADRHAEK